MFRDLLRRRVRASGCERTCVIGGGGIGSAAVGRARVLALICLLGAAPAGWSLGLGDIELDSALNEKLRAEIELLNAEGLQPTEIIVSLASAEDFERVGVERFFFLTDLRFEVGNGPDGLGSIEVTSTQPVTEPYLNFLVEVLWPNGRLLREYTLLLDPPTFSPAPAPGVSAPSQSRQGDASAGRVERRESTATTSRGTQVDLAPASGQEQSSSPLDEGVVDGEYRMTDRSDTLWSIASRTRPSRSVSVQQNMLAIQRLNPDAFLHDNINLLKAGYSLRLPSEDQALSTGSDEANQRVAMQNEDWRALQRGEPVPERSEDRVAAAPAQPSSGEAEPDLQAQVDATPTEMVVRPDTAGSEGELRIVAGESDGAATASAIDTEATNAALEEQDRLSREVETLTDELDREREIASNQIAVKDRQLEVKDQQIAEMQARIEELRAEMERLQAASPEQSQNQSASSTAASWWQSPYALGGAAGAVVLLLAYGLVAARRRRAENDDFYREVAAEDALAMEQPRTVAAGVTALDEDPGEDHALAEDEEQLEPAPMPASQVGESTASETGDVIGEADIYIAYGRYPQAIGLLLGVLEESPERNDVRLKLLELYAETRDREAFDTHLAELLERCEDDEALLTARELGAQFGDDGADNGSASADEAALDLDELPVDDETLHVEAGAEGNSRMAPQAAEDDEPDAPLGAEDFELELDELAEDDRSGAEASQSGHAADALGGDLGLDFDPDRRQNGASVADEPANGVPEGIDAADGLSAGDANREDSPGSDDLDLDLDLDLDDGEVLGADAFDFEDEGDTAGTKLDLARAYIDMGDQDGARDILNEVVAEGNAEQQQRANAMLEEL